MMDSRLSNAARTTHGIVRHYLGAQVVGFAMATLLSLALGLTTAALGALVGPSIKLMAAEPGTVMSFVELFGHHLGGVVAWATGATAIDGAELLEALPVFIALLALAKLVFGGGQWFVLERAGELISMRARDDLASAYLCLSPEGRRKEQGRAVEAALSSAVTTDVRLMREFFIHYYGGLPREIIEVAILAVTMALISPRLTAIFFVGVLPAGVVLARVGRVLRRRAAKALADYSDLSEWMQQRLLGIETIKHYRTEALEASKLKALSQSLYERFLRAARAKARTAPLLQAVAVTAMVLVLAIALHDVSVGRTTGAALFSFLTTLAFLTQSAGKLGRYLNSNREGIAAVDRLRAALGYLVPLGVARVAAKVLVGKARITCRNVEARYEGAATLALRGVSFELTGGRIYCIAGPSGAGKSTLFNLLLGLVKPERGEIELAAPEGAGTLRLAYMPQKVLLAPDSIAANVAYPDETWDVARVQAALAKVEMAGVVAQLVDGLETIVGDGGAGLSGGQAQRILLARLLYHRAPIVLIDEGTSALDPEVERTVHGLLRELADGGAVVVTIAHRRGSAEIADELLLLIDGQLAARGAPRDVMDSPAYRGRIG